MNDEFFKGFSNTIGMTISESKEAWSNWTRQLSDNQREQIERGGFDSGLKEGKFYNDWLEENE